MNKEQLSQRAAIIGVTISLLTIISSVKLLESDLLRDILLAVSSTLAFAGIASLFSTLLSRKLYIERENKPDIKKFIDTSSTVQKKNNKKEQIFNEFIHIYTFYIDIESRISTEITNISRRAYINLILGLSTSLLALAGLFLNLINSTNSYDLETNKWFVTFFIPRISFAILVEALAFYFLRIYKESLETIKYLTNELTNIDMKILSILVGMEHNSKNTLDKVVESLITTDRNSVLKKGESTVELQKLYNNQMNIEKIIESISKTIINK
ncbi:hypothetical protein EHQ23_16890 [Leptospira bourretii]|uniref:Uncharacterized protein n=1 Tax=Leptospira bourretii TaxID=2484962 RepID=A0A4R9IP56_9LEPT|nr:hypothetical protein [Leptospira bourretii]TGK79286.1 hypothetical protein EHQ23_16890 [Leptospira bourretii]TGK92468.1 hypothetical protein EHQ26_08680 [Leptospira bourretii]TGL29243.1 hypothetical protein EHQ45_15030 [Leptospira bourretii]